MSTPYTKPPYTRLIEESVKADELRTSLQASLEIVRSKLDTACKQHGQTTIAYHLGFSTPFIHDVINGKRGVTNELLSRILNRGDL